MSNNNYSTKCNQNNYFLIEHLVSKEPINQFKAWLDEACSRKDIIFPNAFCLATSSKDGFPSARVLMLAYYNKVGFMFFTDYGSRKSIDIATNSNVAASMYWEILNRSVRIEGQIKKISEEESNVFFKSKHVKSQIAVKASYQSTPIESRDVILRRMNLIEYEYVKAEKEIPKPGHWGGYIIRPSSVEFWQGQKNRLSDRIRFRRTNPKEVPDGKILHRGEEGWVYERLSP